MALLCFYTCIPYYPLRDYSSYDRCERLSSTECFCRELGCFLLGFGSSFSPEKIVSVMIISLEESAVSSTICFSGSIIANAVERLAKSYDKCAFLRTTYSRILGLRSANAIGKSHSHSRLGSYEGQNKDWYGLENEEEEEEQEDSFDSETRRRVEKRNVNETLKMPRRVTTDGQLQQLANRMRITYFRGRISSYTLTVSAIYGRRRKSNDIWQTV
ncbi:hypothetical protein ALC57_09348 [Trachymyrmex cornetzi]|uniref:Uncharacterized protein n=1 Tax=Trachymyrmex cornetzi TaxID=471704 RepID=A0A151J5I6_9HYME|nr:hypothetical protein ALC57_09348 [Trachymyrmex cornetzi]